MGKLTGIIQYSGKLSNSVGMRGQDGRNYIRIRRTEIKNPKSDAQCIQRMILATVAKSIAFLSVVLSSAVEGKANGAETLAYLRGQWMRMLRTSDILSADSQYEYLKKNADTFSLNPYLLSKGSIVTPAFTVNSANNAIDSPALHGITVGESTASEVFLGVAVGNQITIVAVYNDDTSVTDGVTPRRVKYCRFAFKDDETIAVTSAGKLNSAALDLVKAEGDWSSLIFDYGQLRLSEFIGEGNQLVGASILISNIEGKQRSTSYLVLADNVAKQWSGAEAYQTYGDQAVPIDLVSSEYLNNSTTPVSEAVSENAIVSMNFSLPITFSDLSGKTITMRSNVSLEDCIQHLKAKDSNSASWYVNQDGQLSDGEQNFNSVECSGSEITFGVYDDILNLTEITWE